MNNNQFGNNFPQSNIIPSQNANLIPNYPQNQPFPIMRCGADQLKIRPRPINIKEAKPKNNNQIPVIQQPNPNVNMGNNNILPNNSNNNSNSNFNNQQNIPPQWKDFY